ncbi:phage tail protein [Stakelama tenebrarum]|uniref:Uncharacterized protein n=1 Tax=Stakelama tenebrarum TaxID=2711215 RepID=A0A6G6Y9G3_9SPHN|nr:phage tail protein [Sphingosinithalassobacter tenebrarum]QIG81559.1 hypothetical protein G5C33_18380 [Sphingosinithalassobacter tenebrarum]
MATLVLTAAGTMLGGPVGGAIGATLGGTIDREVLFKPGGREGPRLTELAVQTSSYGTQIPRLFGAMRVAGSVIWATDLIEHRSTSGGKGQPRTTSYGYTVSLAVALSGRPIRSVGRIWADGKLLRGAAGDFKVRTGYRLYHGREGQPVDPLIAAAEGADNAPAYRGVAYAVFEDLDLAEYGNRIPSMTFEIFADEGAVAAADIAAELSGGLVSGESGSVPLEGFSAQGASLRAVAETLAGAANGWFGFVDTGARMRHGAGDAIPLSDDGMRSARGGADPAGRSIASIDGVPRSLSLTHYDAARDYQAGLQRAVRPGAGIREARLELPAAISAGSARTIAQAALARLDRERERRTLTLGWEAIGLSPGTRVTVNGTPGLWRVDRWSLEAMVLRVELLRITAAPLPVSASGGRVLSPPDLRVGDTVLQAFELPLLDEAAVAVPRLGVAAAGTGSGWRSAGLLLSTDGGGRWGDIGATALPAVLGTVDVAPGSAPASLIDHINHIDVTLAQAGMTLADADDLALDGGANLALIGEELVQFGSATALGEGQWRLATLWRGRRGTEDASGDHQAGEPFVLIDGDTLRTIDLAASLIGGEVHVLAQGAGDSEGVSTVAPVTGRSVLPLSPVHPEALRHADGTTSLKWIRRSRSGWRWIDGVDAPLGEEAERYRLTITPTGGDARVVEVSEPGYLLSSEDRLSGCAIAIRQVGTFGTSSPLELQLSPAGESQ